MKYVIRNCPAKYSVGASNMKCSELGGDCDTKTDCLLKQIVELCKEDWEDMTVSKFQSELLNKIDIEEDN